MTESIRMDAQNNKGEISTVLFVFEDHGHQVAYLPSLKLSAYGNKMEDAKQMLLEEALPDFFENLILLNELEMNDDLAKYGWKKSPLYERSYLNSNTFVDARGVLRNFNLSAETHVEKTPIERQFMAA